MLGNGSRCGRCDAPLAPVARDRASANGAELFGRRRSTRIARGAPLVVYADWQGGPQPARLHDLSFEGASIDTTFAVAKGAVLRIVSRDLDALVQVINLRQRATPVPLHRLHSRLLTVALSRRDGVFVSTTA